MINEFQSDKIDSGDDELLALEALLAEVENESVKTKGFMKDPVNTVDIDNVNFYLKHKFNKYGDSQCTLGDSISKPSCSSSKSFGADLCDGTFTKKMPAEEKKDVNKTRNMELEGHIFTDPVFGLRIVNPQISSISLIERMANRRAVKFNALSRLMLENFTNDWVVAGVILSKETKFNSKTANPFSIWKMSDLKFGFGTICVMLFQTAHHDLWKTPTGMCVAILNPSFVEKKSYSKDIANLSIDSAKKVMILGKSKDFGVCKAKKKNGDQCKNFVNLNECDFCVFHVGKAYKNMEHPFKTKEMSTNNSYGKLAFKSKSLSGNNGKILHRDKKIMDSLTKFNKSSTDNMSVKPNTNKSAITCVSDQRCKSIVASNVEAQPNQRRADIERLKTLDSSLTTFKNMCSANKIIGKFGGMEPKVPAMQKAIDVLRKCPVEKVNPNSVRGTKEGKKRAIAELTGISESKRRKIEKSPELVITDILETVSVHRDLIDFRQKEEEDKYFDKLATKEIMEEKMLNTYKLPCKAVICKVCKYIAFSAADHCKKERHFLKVTDAVKRFFQCRDCGSRTTTLFKLPKISCANCTGSRWEHCAMIRDRHMCDTRKSLSVRGDEETFLGSTSSRMNINLLVPTD